MTVHKALETMIESFETESEVGEKLYFSYGSYLLSEKTSKVFNKDEGWVFT